MILFLKLSIFTFVFASICGCPQQKERTKRLTVFKITEDGRTYNKLGIIDAKE